MPQFRKKPVVIEAMQWIGPDPSKIEYLTTFDDWISANQGSRKCRYRGQSMIIPTLEGDHEASPGDWIIRGIKGELYPCKPDIFAATYEAI
ncbi:hypothetical protein [Mesorhizobium sp. LNJC391B00]|uniref:hypothetical protein n=1 Tax=Mesorhizobium sp. LNJC391B00 TaxID=1287273 RepID=UPI0003CF0D59|nr:hypothetical protein [Mesorhizobium sp. LNJC391B00]ESY26748.1 hypothetical protein X749_24235 [Mesorhizobium sp. LNJC391B00]